MGKNCSENEKIIVIRIYYFNPAFSEMYGWTLDELAGRHIPYVPLDLVKETGKGIKKPTPGKFIRRFETRRLTKDGRVLDAAVRVATFSEGAADDDAQLAILIDLTPTLQQRGLPGRSERLGTTRCFSAQYGPAKKFLQFALPAKRLQLINRAHRFRNSRAVNMLC